MTKLMKVKCTVRHVKKIWFSANQACASLKRLGYVSIYPPKNFKSIAGLEPYHMEGQNFGNLEWLLDFLGFHIIASNGDIATKKFLDKEPHDCFFKPFKT